MKMSNLALADHLQKKGPHPVAKPKKEIFMIGPDATQADIDAVIDKLHAEIVAYHASQKRKKKKTIPRKNVAKKKRQ